MTGFNLLMIIAFNCAKQFIIYGFRYPTCIHNIFMQYYLNFIEINSELI